MLLLCLVISSAAAEDETVTLPASQLRAMVQENDELRKALNELDKVNDELFRKWRERANQQGVCT